MRIRILSGLLVFILIFTLTPKVYGLSTVTFMEGQSIFVDLSLRNLNLIKFPSSGVRVYTSSKVLDIKVD